LVHELRDAWRTEPRDHLLALVCLCAIGVVLRLMYLAQPMRYDEAVTYTYFVRLPWLETMSTYTYPNNHVFHSLLVKASVAMFGSAPWALRIPAFVAGSLVIPATYAVTRTLYGSRAALLAVAIVSSSGILVLYSTSARGYSLIALAFLLLVLIAIRLLKGATAHQWVAFALVGSLGLWTIPVMLYPLGTIALWFAISAGMEGKRAEVIRLAVALGVTAALTLLLYSPILAGPGLEALTRNRFVTPTGWSEFASALSDTIVEALRSWSLGVPLAFSLMLLGFVVIALLKHRAISRFRSSLPFVAFVWCAALLIVTRRAPFPRVWLWLLPLAASLAAAGIVYASERWSSTRSVIEHRIGAIAVILAIGFASFVVTSFAVLLSRDTGTFREAEDAAAALSAVLRPGDRVLAGIPTNGPLDYYLHRHGIDRAHLSLDEGQARRVFVIVDDGEGQTLDRLTAHSGVRDSTRFSGPVVAASFPASRIYLYQRRSDAR
jgi:4-amino-4-deoxy-L-arabinose transferase-like glycosyltransferase